MINKLQHITQKINPQVLFYVGMILLLPYSLNFMVSPEIPNTEIFLALAVLMLVVKVLLTQYTLNQKVMIVLSLLLSLIQYQVNGLTYGIVLLLVVISSKGIEPRRFMKRYICLMSLTVLILFILSLTGIRGHLFLEAEFGETRGVLKRFAFGFDGPNRFAVIIMGILSASVYVWWDKFRKVWAYLILLLLVSLLFFFTKSRTGLISSVFLLMATLVLHLPRFSEGRKLPYFMTSVFQCFILVFSFWGAFFPIRGYFWTYTDLFFNARFTGAVNLMKGESLNLFGASGLNKYNAIDNSYVAFLYIGGVILYVLYIMGVELLVRYNIKSKNLGAIAVITTFIPICFTTSIMYGIYQNLILLLFIGTWDKLIPVSFSAKEKKFWGKVYHKLAGKPSKLINLMKFEVQKVKVGEHFGVRGIIKVDNKSGEISIGSNVTINSTWKKNLIGRGERTILRTYEDGKIIIGNGVGMSNATLVSMKCISIGNDVFIGGGVCIYDTDFHSLDYEERRAGDEGIKVKAVTIGDGAFIGADTMILKGADIGERAVIGAGSVVAGRVPAQEVWAGNPARFIKNL